MCSRFDALYVTHHRRPCGLVGNLAHQLVVRRKSSVHFLSKQDFYSDVRSGKRENISM